MYYMHFNTRDPLSAPLGQLGSCIEAEGDRERCESSARVAILPEQYELRTELRFCVCVCVNVAYASYG